MKSRKRRYIDHIRTNTAYPTYRAFVWILTILGYVIAGLTLAVGLIILVDLFGIMAFWALRGWPARGIYFVASVVATTIIFFASQLFKEVSFILADIADSITDANSIYLESKKAE